MDKYTQLESINSLKEKGVLTEEEFQTEKKRILGGIPVNDSHIAKSNTSNASNEYSEFKRLLNERISRGSYIKGLFFYIPTIVIGIFLIISFISLALIRFKLVDKVDEQGISLIEKTSAIINLPILLLIIIMYCILTRKRFHDIGKSGWHILIPIYGIIIPLITKGSKEDNRYGSVSE